MSSHKKVNYTLLITGVFILTSFMEQPFTKQFPYANAGLTKRQAAAHLLSRFTYGATADEIEDVVSQGLENWFEKQLNASFEDADLEKRLQQ